MHSNLRIHVERHFSRVHDWGSFSRKKDSSQVCSFSREHLLRSQSFVQFRAAVTCRRRVGRNRGRWRHNELMCLNINNV
jgi:hypothetical protein